jgi:uroporphyrinogen-III synthase
MMLEARGAEVVHVPLISIEEPHDQGAQLTAQLGKLAEFDWLVVTSVPGAERVGAAAALCPDVRLAAVGLATARALAGGASREVDLVPEVQTASALAEELLRLSESEQCRFLVAQADLAADNLVESLRSAGHDVTACIAYRTVLRSPDHDAIRDADALVLVSGSAAQSWVQAAGRDAPEVIVAIGPSTAEIADGLGLKISGVAADHSFEGLVTELERQFSTRSTQIDEV